MPLLFVRGNRETAETISGVTGHLDIAPPLLHRIGFPSDGEGMFGRSVFSSGDEQYAIMRNGDIVTQFGVLNYQEAGDQPILTVRGPRVSEPEDPAKSRV